ncbi:MAG: flagellar hook-length control protein FliK, partial [Caldimicrobium sp.]
GGISFQDLFFFLITSLNDLGKEEDNSFKQNTAALGEKVIFPQDTLNNLSALPFFNTKESINCGEIEAEASFKGLPLNSLNQRDSKEEDFFPFIWNAFLLFLRAPLISALENSNFNGESEPISKGPVLPINENSLANLSLSQFSSESNLSSEEEAKASSLQESLFRSMRQLFAFKETLQNYANAKGTSIEDKSFLNDINQKLEERLQTLNIEKEEGRIFIKETKESFLKFLEVKNFEVLPEKAKNPLLNGETFSKEVLDLKNLGEKFNHLQDEAKFEIINKLTNLLENKESPFPSFSPKEIPLQDFLKKNFIQKKEDQLFNDKITSSHNLEGILNISSLTEKSIFKNSKAFPPRVEIVKIENLPQFIKNFTIELKPSGERSALLELEPPELGKMEVAVRLKEGEVEIVARAEKAETLSYLKEEFLQIKTELENLGLKLKDFQLSLGLSGEEKSFGKRNEERKEQRKEKVNKLSTVSLEEIPTIVYKGRLYKIA